MSHWTSRRPGWMPLLLTLVISAAVGAWAITGPAEAAPTHHPFDPPSESASVGDESPTAGKPDTTATA